MLGGTGESGRFVMNRLRRRCRGLSTTVPPSPHRSRCRATARHRRAARCGRPDSRSRSRRTRRCSRTWLRTGSSAAGWPSRPGTVRHRHRPADGGARLRHRQRRPAAHPAGARLLRQRAGVGRDRIRRDLRRTAAARWQIGRPARTRRKIFIIRPAALLGRVAARRLRDIRGMAAGLQGTARRRRRDGRAHRAGPDQHHVHGRLSAQPGHGRLRRDERRRRRRRPDPRRPAHHVPVVALGAVRQRPHRHRHRDLRQVRAS